MIGRIAWYVLLAALAVVSFGVQIDRQSVVQAELAGAVPAPLRGVAQQKLTALALVQGDAEKGLIMARRLVRERPMPAENLMLLGQAQIANEQYDEAIATIEAATYRGWRVVPAQLAVAEAAIAEENYPAAADRLAAVIATESDEAAGRMVLQRMLASPEGREAMAARLATKENWGRLFVRYALDAVPPADIWDTLVRTEAAGMPVRCDHLLLVQRQYDRASEEVPDLPERCS